MPISSIPDVTRPPQIPGVTLDIDALHPFGCLVIAHKAKEQVTDGYCDARGVAGAFVGWSYLEGVKAISVLLPGNKIEHTVFYKADPSYYPWRPDGQRRLLNDGTFGDEGETARVFTEIPKEINFSELLSAFDDDSDETEATGESAVSELTKGGNGSEIEKIKCSGPGCCAEHTAVSMRRLSAQTPAAMPLAQQPGPAVYHQGHEPTAKTSSKNTVLMDPNTSDADVLAVLARRIF